MRRSALAMAAALAAMVPAEGHACGACVEDKIAATYDHGVVVRAAADGDVMVFCEVTGPLDARRVKDAVRRVPGVKPRSVRISLEAAAVSFAVDPSTRSPQAAVEAAQRTMPVDVRLRIVRLQRRGAYPPG